MKNKHKIDGQTLIVYDCNNNKILFDLEDADLIKNYRWCIANGYAHSNSPTINGKRYTVLGHRLIIKAPKELQVDHINGNRADNRKSNLRIVNTQQNHHNRTKAKGYSWNKQKKKYVARITLNAQLIHLGYYETKAEARAAYLEAKKKYHPTAPIGDYI